MYITLDMVKDAVKSGSKPGEYCAICPSCGERTFYFNALNFRYICFRESCGVRGKFNDSEIESPIDSSFSDLKGKLDSLYIRRESPIHEIDLDIFSDPLYPNTFNKYPFAYQYIKNRGFTDDDIMTYRLRVGKKYFSKEDEKTETKWVGRVIFPFYDSGVSIYAIGRSYNDRKPKYLNTEGEKSVIVYNLERIRKKECIVCEGLISSIFAEKHSGISAVPLLGCSISESQLYQIRLSCNTVWICLDGGVDSSQICKRFFMSGADVYKVNLPIVEGKGLDPAEMNQEDYVKCIENAERFRLL